MKKLAQLLGIALGAATVIWAMRDRLVSIAASREPDPPKFRVVTEPTPPPPAPSSTPKSSSSAGADDLTQIRGIGPAFAQRLAAAGFPDFTSLAGADPAVVADAAGVSATRAEEWVAAAQSR